MPQVERSVGVPRRQHHSGTTGWGCDIWARDQLALVNDQNTAMVYDLASQELMYELGDVNSVAYNTESNDITIASLNDIAK